jgi:hypothetical protein
LDRREILQRQSQLPVGTSIVSLSVRPETLRVI